jgi:hypothetical protein
MGGGRSRSLEVYGSLAREKGNCVTGDHGRVSVGDGRGKRGTRRSRTRAA